MSSQRPSVLACLSNSSALEIDGATLMITGLYAIIYLRRCSEKPLPWLRLDAHHRDLGAIRRGEHLGLVDQNHTAGAERETAGPGFG